MKLKLVVFICGAAVMALEILGSRIIAPCYGNSLYAWGSLIGVILGALTVGYYLGGKIADNGPSFYGLSIIILVAGFSVAFIPLFSSVVIDSTIAFFLGMKYGPLFSVIVLFAAPGMFLGMVSPYAVKLETRSMNVLGNVAGNLYAISTLGSIAGTFATSFFLIPEVGVKDIVYTLSIVLILTALLCAGKRILPKTILGLIFFGLVMVLTSSHSSLIDEEYKIVFQKDTAYYEIKIMDYKNSTKRMMYLDASLTGGQYSNSSKTACTYTDYFHLPFIINPKIKDVLFLGCGAGTGPKRFHEEYENVYIDVVDIDPAVNEAAVKYFDLKEDNRLRLYTDEGRSFLANSHKKYDLVVLDVFNSVNSIPFHLMTKEFITDVREHLTDEGVLILNIHGSIKGSKSKLFLAEYKTYRLVFPNVYVFPVGSNLSQVQNIIIIASKSDKRISREELIEKAEELAGEIRIKRFGEYAGKYLEEDLDDDAPILTDDYAPVDNLLLPILERQ